MIGMPSSLVICGSRVEAWVRQVSTSGWLSTIGLPMKTKSLRLGHSYKKEKYL